MNAPVNLVRLRLALPTYEQRTRGRHLADVIAACTMDARPPVLLPSPAEPVEPLEAVVFVEPRCPVCKTRSVMPTYFAANADRWGTCGADTCHRESIRLKHVEWPLGLQIKPPPKRGSRR